MSHKKPTISQGLLGAAFTGYPELQMPELNIDINNICSEEVKPKNISELEKGDHIKYKRIRGVYCHHAIVTDIMPDINEYEFIHFTNDDGGKIGSVAIKQERKQFKPGKVVVIKYKKRLSREETVERAQLIFKKQYKISYNLVTSNCEHLATHCVLGKSKSDQVDTCLLANFKDVKFVAGKSIRTQLFADTINNTLQ